MIPTIIRYVFAAIMVGALVGEIAAHVSHWWRGRR